MLLRKGLIFKLGAIDGLATSAIARCEVAALNHELLDDAMEGGALIVKWLSRLADPLLARAEGAKVVNGLGDEVGVKLHGDASDGLAAKFNVEEDPRTLRFLGIGHCAGVFLSTTQIPYWL